RRDQPFETDVADGKAVGGGVVVVLMPHGLARTVDQKMMDQVAAAQEANFVAVQQTMKPVAKEFREQTGEEQRERRGANFVNCKGAHCAPPGVGAKRKKKRSGRTRAG